MSRLQSDARCRLRHSSKDGDSFGDCLRRCEECGIGISNGRAAGKETVIYRNVLHNVIPGLRDEFLDVLSQSLNELNRTNKVLNAAYSTSEDALTWNYFNHLRLARRLQELNLFQAQCESKGGRLLQTCTQLALRVGAEEAVRRTGHSCKLGPRLPIWWITTRTPRKVRSATSSDSVSELSPTSMARPFQTCFT